MSLQLFSYSIKPLEGREFIQRNFVSLPDKSYKYSNRTVTLNERFSIIERGYLLVPELRNTDHDFQRKVRLIPFAQTMPTEQKQKKVSTEQKQKKVSSNATKTEKVSSNATKTEKVSSNTTKTEKVSSNATKTKAKK